MTGSALQDPFGCVACEVRDHGVAAAGPLSGLRYAAKDLFDVAGLPTAAGNPDFARWRGAVREDAWAISCLRRNGAELVAKVHLHELAYGITGVNPHYGTPANPRAPGRLPGGSSSGSAVAVAGGLVPFALGTDTGGSARTPASFCGIHGFRPTFGHVPSGGVVSLAPSFDTVGVLAATAAVLRKVGAILLRPPSPALPFRFERMLIPSDALERSYEEGRAAAEAVGARLGALGLRPATGSVGVLDEARDAQRALQGAEAWAVHQDWITSSRPRLGPDVASLLESGSRLTAAAIGRASAARAAISLHVTRLLGRDEVLVVPATPGPAPAATEFDDPAASLDVRAKLLSLTNLASLVGLPVVAVPGAPEGALPVGVQLIGPEGSDLALLDLAVALEDAAMRREG